MEKNIYTFQHIRKIISIHKKISTISLENSFFIFLEPSVTYVDPIMNEIGANFFFVESFCRKILVPDT